MAGLMLRTSLALLLGLARAQPQAASAEPDGLAELPGDDECLAPSGDDGEATCAFHALQLRATGPDEDMLQKINVALSAKLDDLNAKVSDKMKTKDPMPVNVAHDKVHFDKLYGMSTLHISSLQAVGFVEPTVQLKLVGQWTGDLKMTGSAEMHGKQIPIDVALQQDAFYADNIGMYFNKDEFKIEKFSVSGLKVTIGNVHVTVHMRMPFFQRIISNTVSKKMNKSRGKIEEKMAAKMTEVLTMVLNAKIMEAMNEKIEKKMG